MAAEGDKGRWLQAKAQQLKERALGTADRTRRKQFLLIATEYQRLAHQEDGMVSAVVEPMVASTNNSTPKFGVVTTLRVPSQSTPAVNSDAPERSLSRSGAFPQRKVVDVVIWAILALVAFALLLAPGDQTTQGLHALLDHLID